MLTLWGWHSLRKLPTLYDRHDEGPIIELSYEGGIISVESLNRVKKPLFDPVLASATDDTYVEIAMQYQSYESIYSYANNIATTEGGSHLTGFRSGVLDN